MAVNKEDMRREVSRMSSEPSVNRCPLCGSAGPYTQLQGRDSRLHYCCGNCHLIFTDSRFLPARDEEEARYRTHNNGIQYPGYVNFLNQAVEQAVPHLVPGMRGLDYGCGPAPTLSILLERLGVRCENYDPIFRPGIPEGPFDIICATECLEHFFSPDEELRRIHRLLSSKGLLVIMTELWTTLDDFRQWHYTNDVTHVCFYHSRTIDFVCGKYGFRRLESGNVRVILLRADA